MKLLKYFTKGDIVLVVSLFILSVASLAGVRNLYKSGKNVVVEVEGRHVLELSLGKNVTKSVKGPLGETIVIIEKGKAKVIESPCPHKYCIRMGQINRRGEVIVCVPNRVVVKIRGGSEEESYDGVTQ